MNVTTSARIRIETESGEVLRTWSIYGLHVRSQSFHLSDLERVSLNRTYRRGYQVALVGPRQDLIVLFTLNLATAREQAEALASACRLKVADHL